MSSPRRRNARALNVASCLQQSAFSSADAIFLSFSGTGEQQAGQDACPEIARDGGRCSRQIFFPSPLFWIPLLGPWGSTFVPQQGFRLVHCDHCRNPLFSVARLQGPFFSPVDNPCNCGLVRSGRGTGLPFPFLWDHNPYFP